MTDTVQIEQLDKHDVQQIINEAEKRADAKRAGYVGGTIACILAILSIFIMGVVFLPIAIVIAIFSTINALSNGNIGGILYNLLAWVLIVTGAFTSPAFLLLIAAFGFSFSTPSFDLSEVTKSISSYEQTIAPTANIEENNDMYKGLSLEETMDKSCESGGTVCERRGYNIYWGYRLDSDYMDKYGALSYDAAHSTNDNKFFCLLETCFLYDIEEKKIHIKKINDNNQVINNADGNKWASIYNEYSASDILKEGKTCSFGYCASTPDWSRIAEKTKDMKWSSLNDSWSVASY